MNFSEIYSEDEQDFDDETAELDTFAEKLGIHMPEAEDDVEYTDCVDGDSVFESEPVLTDDESVQMQETQMYQSVADNIKVPPPLCTMISCSGDADEDKQRKMIELLTTSTASDGCFSPPNEIQIPEVADHVEDAHVSPNMIIESDSNTLVKSASVAVLPTDTEASFIQNPFPPSESFTVNTVSTEFVKENVLPDLAEENIGNNFVHAALNDSVQANHASESANMNPSVLDDLFESILDKSIKDQHNTQMIQHVGDNAHVAENDLEQEEQSYDAFGKAVRRQDRRHWYQKKISDFGANYRILDGRRIDAPAKVSFAANINKAKVLFQRYVSADIDDRELFGPPIPEETLPYGDDLILDSNEWTIVWEPDEINSLQTLHIQGFICAALNSRLRMRWLIGIDNGKIVGCDLGRMKRDMIASAFVWSIGREFVPELNPQLVDLRFIEINGGEGRVLVEITVKDTVDTFYQLSSGRCCHMQKGHFAISTIEEVRQMIESHKNKDHENVSSDGYTIAKGCAIFGLGMLSLLTAQKIFARIVA